MRHAVLLATSLLSAAAVGQTTGTSAGEAPVRPILEVTGAAPAELPAPLDGPPSPGSGHAAVVIPVDAPLRTLDVLAAWAGMHQEYSYEGPECTLGCPLHDRVPDPHGGVGPTSIVAVTNRRIACYDKTGNLLWGPIRFVDFWAGTSNFTFDPRAIYDRDTGRFFVVALDSRSAQSFLNLAVSKSSSPVSGTDGDWWFHRLDLTEPYGGAFYGGDYPCLGTDGQGVYVTFNMGLLPLGSGPILNCQIVVLDKADLVSGVLDAGTWTRHFTPPTGVASSFTLQPAKVASGGGPGNVAYFAEVPRYECDFVRLWAITDPLGLPALVGPATVPVPCNGGVPLEANGYDVAFARQCNVSTREGSLTPLAPRAMDAAWTNGVLWLCHTAGGGVEPLRSIVYYYALQTNDFPNAVPALLEAGAFDGRSDGTYGTWSYMPALGANARGDLCVAFTRSAYYMPLCTTIMVSTRAAGDLGWGTPWPILTSPTEGFDLTRWGDFAVVGADPVDDSFWVCHEWVPSTTTRDWSTWWANIPAEVRTDAAALPEACWLAPVAPNPVRGASVLRYALANRQHVTLRLFDVAGRRVATLVDGVLDPGWHAARLDDPGLPAGVYLCTLVAGGRSAATQRVILLR